MSENFIVIQWSFSGLKDSIGFGLTRPEICLQFWG